MHEKLRILLVDDEPTIVKMVGKRLEVEGFDVRVAMDGQEALQKTHTEQPDLIILDLMLPKVDGYEVCARLKRDPQYRQIPIMLFTARTQEHDRQRGMGCGADAYLCKPFKSQEMLAQIWALMSRTAPAERPA